MNFGRSFWAVIRHDLTLAGRLGGGGGMALGFFVMAIALIPFGVGPDLDALARIAPGMLWVALLLSCLLSLDRLFQADFEDGTLDLYALSPLPLEALVVAKCLVHWLTTGLPLIIAAPVLGLLLNLDTALMPQLVVSMLLGSPALSLIGAIGAALTVSVRRGGLLTTLLVLPLYVPVLIFGALAMGDFESGRFLLFLGALTLGAGALSPIAAAAALRLQLS